MPIVEAGCATRQNTATMLLTVVSMYYFHFIELNQNTSLSCVGHRHALLWLFSTITILYFTILVPTWDIIGVGRFL